MDVKESYFMNYLEGLILSIPGVIVGFSMHEFGHALAAHKLGDPTPEREGRLTISPRAHIDPLGLLMLIFVHFGWAKPVNTNPRFFKNPRRDSLIVSLAGPLMNLAVAVLFALIVKGFIISPIPPLIGFAVFRIIFNILVATVGMNILLLIFNLLPLAPLDGFAVLASLVPDRHYSKIDFLAKHGQMILMVLIISSVIGLPILSYIISIPQGIVIGVISLIFNVPLNYI